MRSEDTKKRIKGRLGLWLQQVLIQKNQTGHNDLPNGGLPQSEKNKQEQSKKWKKIENRITSKRNPHTETTIKNRRTLTRQHNKEIITKGLHYLLTIWTGTDPTREC